jgi:phospholipid/cholesterol/gamma-HCH transport system ATP-binding protein
MNKAHYPIALDFRQVHLKFNEKIVLKDISLQIPAGKTTVLLGPSGAGKSTLMHLAIGLLRPSSGDVMALGYNLSELTSRDLKGLRQRMGMAFQDGALFGSMSVFDNVAFPLKKVLRKPAAEIKEQVHQLLDAIGLFHLQDRLPSELSGGQKKRVGLARALAIEPELVFFDEPTSGLDSITSASIDALINKLQETFDVTFVVITHDVQSAAAIADRVAVLDHGQLLAYGTQQEVWDHPHEVVQALIQRQPLGAERSTT